MRNENVPAPTSPERPPLAPHDPPDPAPQAAAWLRAIKVVVSTSPAWNFSSAARNQPAAKERPAATTRNFSRNQRVQA